MNKDCGNATVDGVCLRVFCAMTASVTHEIKNTLSIINENVGLLEDLGSLADEGAGVPVQYVDNAAKTVAKQVARSNTIMKNLNSFSHSGDRIPAQADLHDTLLLMAALTSRFAAMQKISVTVSCPNSVEIRTNLLVLQSLLFTTLCTVYPLCNEGDALNITADTDGKRQVTVRLALEGDSIPESHRYPGPEEQILASEIGVVCRSQDGEILIDLSACAL